MNVGELTQYYHEILDEYLLLHQEAVVMCLPEAALSIWQQFIAALMLHLDIEDTYIFSCHEYYQPEARWPVSLYRHEHKKIRAMCEAVEEQLTVFCKQPSPRGVIALLDHQRRFKNVLEHHEQREEIALLKELELLPEEVLSPLKNQLLESWPTVGELKKALSDAQALLA